MDTLRPNEFKELASFRGGPCVTVYLPTNVAGPHSQQDVVRLKNLMDEAERRLADGWLRAPQARDLVEPARKLPVDAPFWAARSEGLAIFLADGLFRAWRLPSAFDESVHVGERFHLKPLLPLTGEAERFLLLTLSQNKVRLFSGTRRDLEEVRVEGMPAKLDTALNYTQEPSQQVHSAASGSMRAAGKQAAVFHGQGGEPDSRKDDLLAYFRMVDIALKPVLRDERAPLLLAGVDYLLPIYREANSYPHVADRELSGNFDYLAEHQIHEQAWPLVEPLLVSGREQAEARYRRLAGTGKTSDDIRQVAPMAEQGRVDALFVDRRGHAWGRYESGSPSAEVHDECHGDDDDLLDLAAVQTLLNRGAVYAVERDEVPSETGVAAVLRY